MLASDVLFSQNPNRVQILSLKKCGSKQNFKVFVHRNHSFETIASVINKFLDFSKIEAQFEFSSYDDSLTFGEVSDADLHILWLDLSRYSKDVAIKFLEEKLFELRSKTSSHILLAYMGAKEDFNFKIQSFTCFDVDKIISKLREDAFDYKKEKFSGTILSSKSLMLIAQYLGLRVIPSILLSSIKAIVVDLDNTLYSGILGEDGIENLKPNNDFQKYLKALKEQGFMLAIVSKNEEADVFELFNKRTDFELKKDDFTVIKANWNLKSKNIEEAVLKMNIGYDSVLFIDDNIAEIENVKNAISEINTILFTDENETLRILNLYPRLIKANISNEDKIRSNDIKANEQRQKLAQELTPEEYFKKLEMKVTLNINDTNNVSRISELLNKTNQFILTYKRYNEIEVKNIMSENNSCIITAAMKDKLSDSGIIAIGVFKNNQNDFVLDELTISCRALGRNIEDIIVQEMFLLAKKHLKVNSDLIKINYKKGQRNLPALNWLENFAKNKIHDQGIIEVIINNNFESYGLFLKPLEVLS